MNSIIPAENKQHFKTIAKLAEIIWTEHYTPIIGEAQVSYMLEKYQTATVIEEQVENGVLYYIILLKDEPSGYFSVSKQGDSLFLSKLYVLKSARKNGLGKRAVSFMEGLAKEFGLHKIRLTVNKYNTNSIKAYERMGFKNVDAIVQDIGNGFVMDDYVLEKEVK